MVGSNLDLKKAGRILAFIPAKAASTRLSRKNIRKLAGRSLLEWAVVAAKETNFFDSIVVSTEDSEIAEEARRLGAEVPFIRPAYLAVDPAGVVDVALHALDELEKQNRTFDTLVILLPTSPFRTAEDIEGAMKRYVDSGENFLMSITKHEHSPLNSLILEPNGMLTPLHPEWTNRLGAKAKSGEIPYVVRCNGAVTIVNVERFKQEKNYYAYPLVAYEMPWKKGIDIDTEEDLFLANYLLERDKIFQIEKL